MAYYLESSEAANEYVTIPALPDFVVGSDVQYNIEFKAWTTPSGVAVVLVGSNFANYLFLRGATNEIHLRVADVDYRHNITDATNEGTIYRIESRLNGGSRTIQFFENGNLIATSNPTGAGSSNMPPFARICGNSTAQGDTRLKYLSVENPLDSADDRYYDPSASNGTGSLLPNTLDGTGATDGTLVNFTLPDAWVWYSQFAIDPTQWTRRVEITDANVSPSLTGFTALITQANLPAEIFSRAGVVDGGGDLRVCLNSDGTGQLPLEVVEFTKGTSTAVLWTRFPSFASGTSLWLFYDKPGETQPPVTDAFGRNAVWQERYQRLNLDETSGTVAVSSTGANNGTYTTPLPRLGANGGQLFSSGDSGRVAVTPVTLDLSSFTISATILPNNNSFGQILSSDGGGGTSRFFQFRRDSNSTIRIILWDDSGSIFINTAGTITVPVSSKAWVDFTFDGSTYRTYVNGIPDLVINNTTLVKTPTLYFVGQSASSPAEGFNGEIFDAEVWSGATKSGDYILTEQANQNSPNTFWSTGTPENTTGGATGVTGNAVFDITKPTFSIAGSATVPSPTGDIAFDITKPRFSASGAATLPQAIGNISYSIDRPTFSSSGSATLPQPIGDIAYTINAPTFSVSGSATLPNPTGNAVFDISKPLFSGEGSATTPNPIGNIDITITKPSFSGQGQATLPQPTGNIDFAINAPLFSGQGAAIGFEPIGNIAFDISSPTFSASGSATLPQPVGNASFTIDKPIFDILGSQSGVVISYSPDAIITVNSGQNIIIVTND